MPYQHNTGTGTSSVIRRFSRMAALLMLLAAPQMSVAYVGDYDGKIELEPVTLASGGELSFDCRSREVSSQRIEVGIHPLSVGNTDWTIELADSTGTHSVAVNVSRVERNRFDFDHDENIEISMLVDGELVLRENQGNKLPISRSPIYLRVQLDGTRIAISAGAKVLYPVGKTDYNGFIDRATISSPHDIVIDRYYSMYMPDPVIPQVYPDEQSVISALAHCNDGRCHLWEFFDEEVETRIALKGGRYKLALLPATGGGYDIIYISGAEVNYNRWKTGMLKGRLIPTPFADTFTLYWIDSAGKEISDGTPYAVLHDAVMTLVFPIHKAKFRFVSNRQ